MKSWPALPPQGDEPKIPGRFEFEWAAERSPMPIVAKDIVYALARRIEAGTPIIPLQHMPSLTKLAKATGWSRRHVERALNYLELTGVVTRVRPSIHDAQTKHARTSYTIHHDYLLRLGTGSPKDSKDAQSLGLGPPRRPPRAKKSPGLETGSQAPRDTAAHSQISPELPDRPDQSDLVDLVIRELQKRTGSIVGREWAETTRDLLLARPGIVNPRAYIIRTITTDPHPERWLPTPVPPSAPPRRDSNE